MTDQDGNGQAPIVIPGFFKRFGPVVIIAVVAAVVWHKTLSNDFVWYDVPYVQANLALRDGPVAGYFTDPATTVTPGWPGLTPVFRPLRSLSYRLDFMIAGAMTPGVGHAHGLILHVVNALLLLALARALGLGTLGSLFVALLFLVHPAQSEAVCWLVCRDVLMATTLVLTGLLYAVWRTSRGWRLLDVAVLGLLYLAACLASPQAILFPVLASVFVLASRATNESSAGADRAGAAGRGPWVLWSAVAVLVAVTAVYVRWSLAVHAGGEPFDFVEGAKVKLLAVPRSIGLLLAPVTLSPDYSDIGTGQAGEGVLLALGGLMLAFVVFLVVRCWAVQPALSAALALCVVCMAAAWRVEGTFFGERILYMPIAGFALAAGLLLQRLAGVKMQAAGIVAGAILALASIRTMARVPDWSTEEGLLRPALEYSPGSKPVLRQLMRCYLGEGDADRATIVADGLIAEIPEGPGFSAARAEPLRVKAMAMISTGAVERGEALLAETAAASPHYGRPVHDLGLRARRAGRTEEAIQLFQKACELMPYDGPAHEHLGIAMETAGRLPEAEKALKRAADVEWRAPTSARRLAVILIRQGRMAEAAELCRRSLRRFPEDPDLTMWLDKAEGPAETK